MNKLLVAILIGIFLAVLPAQVFAVKVDRATIEKYSYVCGPAGELCSPMGGPLDGPVFFEAKPRNLTVETMVRDETVEVKEFKAKYGGKFTSVEWDEKRKFIKELYGYYDTGRGKLNSKASAEKLAKDFLKENAKLFKIDMAQMKFKQVDDWMVDYEQYYGDIPVYRGEVRVVMNGNAVIKDVLNDFYPGINISTETRITKEKAVEIVETVTQDNLTVNETRKRINKTVLYIVPRSEDGSTNYYLTWRVPEHEAYYFIDAIDGSLVYKEPTVASAQMRIYGYLNGSIYPDKGSTGGSTLTSMPFRNQSVYIIDEDPVSQDDILAVPNSNSAGFYDTGWMSNSGGWDEDLGGPAEVNVTAYLEGPHAKVTNDYQDREIRYQYLGNLIDEERRVDFDWGTNYEESVFYHVERGWEWFNTNVSHDQPQVHAHIPSPRATAIANGGYDSAEGEYFIWWNQSYLDYTYNSDTVLHEYGHTIQFNIYGRCPTQEAVCEGWPSYFAASINDDAQFAEDWNLDNPDASLPEAYHFAGALWDIRKAIGAVDADKLIWNATKRYKPDTTSQFFKKLLDTDDDPDMGFGGNGNINDGTPHFDEIWEAFYLHGIIMPKIQASYNSGQVAVTIRANGIGPELHWKLGWDEDITGGIRYWYDLDNNPNENLVSEGFSNGPIGLFYYGHTVIGEDSDTCSVTRCTYWTHVPGTATEFTLLESNDVRAVIGARGVPHMYDTGAADNNVEFTVNYTVYATGKVGIRLAYNWIESERLIVGTGGNDFGSEIFLNHVDGSTAWIPRTEHDSDVRNGYSGTASSDSFLLWSSNSGNRLADIMLSFYGDWNEANTILYEDHTELDMEHLFWRNTNDHTHSGQQPTRYFMQQLGTEDSILLPDLDSNTAADFYSEDYQTPATFNFTKGSYSGFDAGELAYEMTADSGSNTTFTMYWGGKKRHNPVFKIYGYTCDELPTVKLDGLRITNYNVHLDTATDTLILQYIGDITSNVVFDIIDPEPTPPTVSVTGAPSDWQNTDATATVSCVDSETGCDLDSYRLKTYTSEPDSCPAVYSLYTLTSPQTISSYAWVCGTAKDSEGTPGFSMPTEFKVDKTAPTGTITINDGAVYTNSPSVTLTPSCSDTSGCSEMQFSNDGTGYSTPEAYATIKAWNLTAGDGTKTVYVKYNDSAGNLMTSPATDDIILDTTPPTITITSPTNTTYNTSTVDLNVSADETIDTWWYNLNDNATNTTFTPNTTITGTPDSNKLIVYANDTAGNLNSSTVYFTIGVYTPQGSNISVELGDEGSIIFSEVNESGYTQDIVTADNEWGPIPGGFNVSGDFHNITTTANYTGLITVSLWYNESKVSDENNLKIFHWNGTDWEDVTSAVDTVNDIINGTVASLSPFVVVEEADPSPTTTITSPQNTTITDTTPDLNLTTDELANITYSWNNEGNISGCRNCTSFNTTYGESVLDTNTSLLFHFNEYVGNTTYDDSSESNNGTLGNSSGGNQPAWTADGKFGNALSFDGGNDFVNVTDDDSLDFGTDDFTITAWIKTGGVKGFITNKLADWSGRGSHTWVSNKGIFGGMIHDTGEDFGILGTTEVNDSQWHHVAFIVNWSTFPAGTAYIYVDGVQEANDSIAWITESLQNDEPVVIGSGLSASTNLNFSGTIDEVHIVRRALNATEIEHEYNKTLSIGQHSVTVYAVDNASNSNSETRWFTVNTTPPVITIDSPANDTINDTTPDLNFTVNETANVIYSWNDEGNISGCRSCTSYNTTYGEYANSSEQNLSAVWHFNENTGTTLFDETANDNDGVITGAAYQSGKFGYGLKFDGNGDFINISYDSTLDVLDNNDSFTFAAWFKLDALPSTGTAAIYSQNAGTGTGRLWLFVASTNDRIYTGLAGGGKDTGITAVTGTWYFAVIRYNGTDLQMYIDDVLTIDVVATADEGADGEYYIGSNNAGSAGWFNGTIDEIMLFDRNLSAAEIQELYSKTLPAGQHSVTVWATDVDGDQNSTTKYFTIG